MSDMSEDPNDYASEVQAFMLGSYIIYAAATLYCYEWLVTIGQEFDHVWMQKWTISTWIFAISRYSTLLDVIVLLIPTPSYTRFFHIHVSLGDVISRLGSCIWILRLDQTFTALQFLALALFTALRAFALCARNICIFLVVFLLSITPFVVNVMSFPLETPIFVLDTPANDCQTLPPFPDNVSLHLSLGTRGAIIVADVIVLVITWMKTIETIRQAMRVGTRVPLHEVLVRDGTIFFLALLVLNVFQILTDNIPALLSLAPGTTFLPLLTSVIISRFVLNLKQASTESAFRDTTKTNSISTVLFNSSTFVGNIGESLDFNSDHGLDVERINSNIEDAMSLDQEHRSGTAHRNDTV